MLTCYFCGYTGEDVGEYPIFRNGKDTTEYMCSDVEACIDRQIETGRLPSWLEKAIILSKTEGG